MNRRTPTIPDTNPHAATEPQGEADETLVARLRAGDEASLSLLYRRYVQAIYRFVLGQVRDHDLAEDLTSDTFAGMLRGLAGYRSEASFKNWLYQIARNTVRNHRRSAGYRLNLPLSPALAANEADPAPLAAAPAHSQRAEYPLPALLRLSRRAKRVIVQNLVIASLVIVTLVTINMFWTLPLPLGVLGHEGSTVIVGLNGLRLLSRRAWR